MTLKEQIGFSKRYFLILAKRELGLRFGEEAIFGVPSSPSLGSSLV